MMNKIINFGFWIGVVLTGIGVITLITTYIELLPIVNSLYLAGDEFLKISIPSGEFWGISLFKIYTISMVPGMILLVAVNSARKDRRAKEETTLSKI